MLEAPVRPLLTTCALTTLSQGGGGNEIENVRDDTSRGLESYNDPDLTVKVFTSLTTYVYKLCFSQVMYDSMVLCTSCSYLVHIG